MVSDSARSLQRAYGDSASDSELCSKTMYFSPRARPRRARAEAVTAAAAGRRGPAHSEVPGAGTGAPAGATV
eukprot:380983-Hanusia_phi.AAC.2